MSRFQTYSIDIHVKFWVNVRRIHFLWKVLDTLEQRQIWWKPNVGFANGSIDYEFATPETASALRCGLRNHLVVSFYIKHSSEFRLVMD